MLHAMRPYIPRTALGILAHRSIDWWIMSEDLPDKNNRVTITPTGGICVHWVPNNMATHNELVPRSTEHNERGWVSACLYGAHGDRH